jgi:hypothetical protein
VISAAQQLEVVIQRPEPARASMRRMMLGPLARHPPRFEVLVVDRVSRKVVIRAPVDGPEVEAKALGGLFARDLEILDEREFLRRHGRAHRHR